MHAADKGAHEEVAALEKEKRFLGFEIDEKYFNVAYKRIKSAPLTLFQQEEHYLNENIVEQSPLFIDK